MLPWTVLSVLLLASYQTAGSSILQHDNHFDILIFTQHWPYTTCIDWENRSRHNSCSRILQTAWSVHGLWPTQFGKIAPGFCNRTWKFDYNSVKNIKSDLDIYWPDYEMRGHPNSLWIHEWEKHGTCAAQLPAMSTEEKYFQTGITLSKQIRLTEWLKEKNIVPGLAKYTKSEVYNAVMEKTKFRPHIDCQHIDGEQFIKEIKVCFSKNLTLIHCDNIVGSSNGDTLTNSRGSCSEDKPFLYPAKINPTYLSQLTSHHYIIAFIVFVGGLFTIISLMVGLMVKKTNRNGTGYESL